MAELRGLAAARMVVAGDPFDGILRAAASRGADLVVMGAHRKQLLRDILVGTTIERVIRTGPDPGPDGERGGGSHTDGPGRRSTFGAVRARDQDRPGFRIAGGVRLALVHAFVPLGKGADVSGRAQPGHHRRVRGL